MIQQRVSVKRDTKQDPGQWIRAEHQHSGKISKQCDGKQEQGCGVLVPSRPLTSCLAVHEFLSPVSVRTVGEVYEEIYCKQLAYTIMGAD